MKQQVDIAAIEAILPALTQIKEEVSRVVVGQKGLIDRLLLALISGGHMLVEGLPGLAKTTAIKAFSQAIEMPFSRIQFTPDLLPADLIGTEIYRPQTADFKVKQGPIFTNLLLADEINRAPAKVQSALLEAMQEHQVTIGEQTFQLPKPFIVLATQNPVEQEGTYPLPEAQLDRFMLKLKVDYPSRSEEKEILRRISSESALTIASVANKDLLLQAKTLGQGIYIDSKLEDYIVNIVFATRDPKHANLPHLEKMIAIGSSPRATLNLTRAARIYALLQGRNYVTPQDVKSIAPDVLRHRLILSFEAEARDIQVDNIIQEILSTIDVP